jgi:hypothetical protein
MEEIKSTTEGGSRNGIEAFTGFDIVSREKPITCRY